MNYCNPEGWKKEIEHLAATANRKDFFTYFDGPWFGSVDDAFSKAYDVFDRLFLPYAEKYLTNLKSKVSLDIGYGSGGQVLAASKHFGGALGIDVHDEGDLIRDELGRRDPGKFELFVGNGKDLSPIDTATIDFVHSWVTFIHLPTIEYVNSYLKDILRVLKPGGIGVIYFSRLIRSGKNQNWQEVEQDMEKERDFAPGYREGGPKSKVRSIALQIAMWAMIEMVKRVGFILLDRTASFDNTPEGKIFHGQYGVIFRKPIEDKPKRRARRKR